MDEACPKDKGSVYESVLAYLQFVNLALHVRLARRQQNTSRTAQQKTLEDDTVTPFITHEGSILIFEFSPNTSYSHKSRDVFIVINRVCYSLHVKYSPWTL